MNRNEINSALKRTKIKGKDYVEVNQRILAFWELYPDGRIVTELVSDDGERCLFKASIVVDGKIVATGHAFECKSTSQVNKSSYVENCETSAIGRALGIFGIGCTESIASAEEVEAAIEQQERAKRTPKEKAAAQALWDAENKAFELLGYTSPTEFHEQAIAVRSDWKAEPETMRRIANEILEEIGEK